MQSKKLLDFQAEELNYVFLIWSDIPAEQS